MSIEPIISQEPTATNIDNNRSFDRQAHMVAIGNKTKLTLKNKRFCEAYTNFSDLNTFGNGRQSAIKAGYGAKNAQVTASRLLTQSNVQQYIQELENELKQQVNFSREDALKLGLGLMNTCPTWAVKARLFETLCKIKGYVEPEDKNTQQIALVQMLNNKVNERYEALMTKDVE